MRLFKPFQNTKPRGVKLLSVSVMASLLITSLMPLSALAAENATAATDGSPTVTSSEVESALEHTAGVLAASDQTKTTSDADSAIVATTAGATIDVPKDASEGVTLGVANGLKLDISLPNADGSKDAQTVANGTVAYPSNNGSASAVQATEDGGVRMLTIIDNPNAPIEYDYKITVPNGGHIELTTDGGAVIIDSTNQVIAAIEKSWAKDAKDNPIETYFTTDGQTLKQTVKHNVPGTVYPVTADPRISWSWHGVTLYLSRWETGLVAWSAGAAGTYFGWTGFGGLIAWAAGPAAQWAASRGYCLAIYKSYFYPWINTWAYRC